MGFGGGSDLPLSAEPPGSSAEPLGWGPGLLTPALMPASPGFSSLKVGYGTIHALLGEFSCHAVSLKAQRRETCYKRRDSEMVAATLENSTEVPQKGENRAAL